MVDGTKPVQVLKSQTQHAFDETSEGMKRAAEEAKAHALNAVDTYFDFLSRAISSLPSGGTVFGDKLKDFSERNVTATHQFMRQLGQAKDFQDILRLQAEFVQSQLKAFAEQESTLAEAFTKTAASEVKMRFK